MRLATLIRLVFALILAVTVLPVSAEDPFHVSYRHQNLSSDGLTQSGALLVTVVNVGAEDVQNLTASIAGPNNVTFDNRAIFIGNLAEGQQIEVLDLFHVPQELADPDATEERVTWTVEYTNGLGESVTAEVTGDVVINGKDCYVVEATAEPPYVGIISAMTAAIEKATSLPVAVQSSGQFLGLPYEVVAEYEYEIGGDPLFPLRVGNENAVMETLTSTATIMGETTAETETKSYTRTVEGVEEVIVPAGTFECFKIVERYEDGTTKNTQWYSDAVKWTVHEEDHESGEVARLIRYSLK